MWPNFYVYLMKNICLDLCGYRKNRMANLHGRKREIAYFIYEMENYSIIFQVVKIIACFGISYNKIPKLPSSCFTHPVITSMLLGPQSLAGFTVATRRVGGIYHATPRKQDYRDRGPQCRQLG